MLHILFLILKIIGIILLAILGIAIALVCIVLFVPFRYRVKVETTDGLKKMRLEAKVTWLFHLISAFVTYKEEELDWKARIVWKKINRDDEEPKKEEKAERKEVTQEEPAKEIVQVQEKTTTEKQSTSQETAKESKKSKENLLEKIKCTIKEICDKIKKVKDFITDETNIQALLGLKNELVLFLKRIKPDKIKGYVRFGLEDPYNTGRVLALLSVLYPFYGENIQIYPEFEKEILEGNLFVKGRIHLLHLVTAICKLYFDKNIKMAYRNFKALNE